MRYSSIFGMARLKRIRESYRGACFTPYLMRKMGISGIISIPQHHFRRIIY